MFRFNLTPQASKQAECSVSSRARLVDRAEGARWTKLACGRSFAVLTVALTLVLNLAQPAWGMPAAVGIDMPQWTALHNATPLHPGVKVERSVSIPMSDGTLLRGDVYRPADAAGNAVQEKYPVIVNITPYNKLVSALVDAALNMPTLTPMILDFINSINLSGTPISGFGDLQRTVDGGILEAIGVDRNLVQSGYVQVVVDTRGTGTSQGVWQVLNSTEQSDSVEVLDWARVQSWSNGHLGMNGASYSAISQIQAASHNPQGLDAIFPIEPSSNIVPDVVAPGGGLGLGFLGAWLGVVNAIKFFPDVHSMLRGEFDAHWLQSRLANPAVFIPEIIDGVLAPSAAVMTPAARELMQAGSPMRVSYETNMASIRASTMLIGGWRDIFTNAQWRSLDQLSGLTSDRKKLIMGSGYHATPGADMGGFGQPPRIDVLQRAWFDKWLKGMDNGIDRYATVTSHRLSGNWTQTDSFPSPSQQYRRLYLGAQSSGTAAHAVRDGELRDDAPTTSAQWTIAPGLSTLCSNDTVRDTAGGLVWLDICAQDNRIAESNALTFTSSPVSALTTVSGPMNLHLNTRVDGTDGFFTAVLSDVGPDGRSTVLSTGSMTTSLRHQLDESRSSYTPSGDLSDPYYSLDFAQLRSVEPGTISSLDIGLLATDAALAPGHRLRVSIYALNATHSVPLGPIAHGAAYLPEHVLLNPQDPSWITVSTDRPLS